MTTTSKRPEHVALVSLILSIIFFGVAFFLGRWSGIFAVSAIGWFMLSSALIWFVLTLQFHQRNLAEQEQLDVSQLAKDEQASTIFRSEKEHTALFSVAQRRLRVFEKWFIPILSILIAAYQLVLGLLLLNSILKGTVEDQLKEPLLCAITLMAIAFVSFLLSRYSTGMSAEKKWKPLKAGGSSLLAAAVLCFALAIALALVYLFKINTFLNVMAVIIPVLLAILGLETAVNVVMDIYRPRLKGLYSRTAFDSRLLGIINEPGGILRSAADAIDYQFGFKVSQTWFYKLLEQAIVPLILFAAITLYLLSSVVIVSPDEEAIVEHLGNPLMPSGEVRHIDPGLTFKWPWPVDIVYKYPTKKVMQLNIGYVPKIDPETKEEIREPFLLWGKTHYEEEYSILVASEQTAGTMSESAVPVSLVKANIPVQYRVKDLYAFIYNHNNPKELLESICYQELAKFGASARIEVESEETGAINSSESLLGTGRSEAKRALTERIQQAADRMGLGVEIVFLGLQGIHPPPEVAPDYQKVIGAVQQMHAKILEAQAERNMTLSGIAGSVDNADSLYDLAIKYQQAERDDKTEEAAELGGQLDTAFRETRGDIFKNLRESQSYAYEKAELARATGERFAGQLKAYRAAKDIFKHYLRLSVFEDVLQKVRKYVVVANQNDTQVFIVDVKEKLMPDLYDIGGIEENNQQ
jgi:membrane protease subunit HflK